MICRTPSNVLLSNRLPFFTQKLEKTTSGEVGRMLSLISGRILSLAWLSDKIYKFSS